MSRRPHLTLPAALRTAGALGLLVATASCSVGPARMAVPRPAPEVAESCAALIRSLPADLPGKKHRDTDPESPLLAAYGDPPVEISCGVEAPATTAEARSQCFEVNGVGWYAADTDGGVAFTTVGRALYVEVTVPRSYAPEAGVLTDLSDPIGRHNALITPCT